MALKWKTEFEGVDFYSVSDPIAEILRANGVLDIDSFMSPNKAHIFDGNSLKNVDKAIEMFKKHIDNNSNIAILFDVDVDGLCSGTMVYNFIQHIAPEVNLTYMINPGKSHGLRIDQLTKDMDLVIVPDASSEPQFMEEIRDFFPNLDLLFLDHHEVDMNAYDDEHTIMVNCHDGIYENDCLCGSGVVQKFIEAYTSKYGMTEEATAYYDLVALATIADGMSLKSLENRYYVITGLEEIFIENPQMKALMEYYEDDLPTGVYIGSCGWVLAPKLNSIIRMGNGKERDTLIRGMIGEEEVCEYQPRRKRAGDPKPPVVYESLQTHVARMAATIKSRQDKQVREAYKILLEKIEEEHLDQNAFIVVDGTNIIKNSTLTGLICNRIASEYKRPCLLLRSFDNKTFGGSGRNYRDSDIDLKNYITENLPMEAAGHSGAFGCKVAKDAVADCIAQINEDFGEGVEIVHKVSFEIPAHSMSAHIVDEIASAYNLWGNDVPEPTFMITGIEINANQIGCFNEGRFISFINNGVKYQKKYTSSYTYDRLTCRDNRRMIGNNQRLRINILGKFVYDFKDGVRYPVVDIIDFDSEVIGKSNNSQCISPASEVDLDDFLW